MQTQTKCHSIDTELDIDIITANAKQATSNLLADKSAHMADICTQIQVIKNELAELEAIHNGTSHLSPLAIQAGMVNLRHALTQLDEAALVRAEQVATMQLELPFDMH